MNTIDEKYNKYQNLENPFTTPDIPISPSKERRTRIIHRINKERMTHPSKSVDSTIYDKNVLKKTNNNLINNLFVDDSEF